MCRLPTRTPRKASGPAGSQPFAPEPSALDDLLELGTWDCSVEPSFPDDAVLVGLPDYKNDMDFFPDVDDIVGSDASCSGGLCQEAGLLFAEQELKPQVGTAYPAASQPVQAEQQPSHKPAPPTVSLLAVPFAAATVPTLAMAGLPASLSCAVQQQQQQHTNSLTPKDEHLVSDQKSSFGASRRRRNKSPEEIQAQQERIKKRRRESAQRSRARKNSYVHNIEAENRALQLENETLRAMLRQLQDAAAQDRV